MQKGAKRGVTTADVALVADDARVDEIARMLGGDAESATSREHARELLAAAATSLGAPDGREPARNTSAHVQRPKRRV